MFLDKSIFAVQPTPEIFDFFEIPISSQLEDETVLSESFGEFQQEVRAVQKIDCLVQAGSSREQLKEPSDEASVGKWSRKPILLLIHFYKENFNRMCGTSVKNTVVWDDITKGINKEGFNYTKKQVENKFKYLKQKYTKKKENMGNKASGASPINFDYFDEFNEIFSEKPAITPKVIATSSQIKHKSGIEDSQLEKKKSRLEKQVEVWSADFKERERVKQEDRERRHKERQALTEKAINSFETMMDKLINKI